MTIEPDQIVALAVQAAGTADSQWSNRVVALVPRVAAMFREPKDESDPTSLANTARKVMEAHAFTCEYRDHELDTQGRGGNQPTQRIFVRLYDPNNTDGDYLDADGCQTVRTEPMWSASGRAIRRVIESLQPGQRVLCYRYTEQIDKKKKMGLLVHIEPLGRPPAGSSATQAPAADRQGTRPSQGQSRPDDHQAPARGSQPSAPEPHSSEDNAAITEIEKRVNALKPRQMIAYRHSCKAEGIENFMAPEPGQMATAMKILEQLERAAQEGGS